MKIKSSKQLKESMKNLDNVVNFKDDEVEVHSDMGIVMTAAYDEDIKAEEHIKEIKTELEEKAEDVIPENPEAPMPDVEPYTTQLKLDESLEDFDIVRDGRSRKTAAYGEDEGDRYTDYTMFDFVSELLSGKNCNTNPAPITPIVWRRDPKSKKGEFKYLEMKKFMTAGEDNVSYGGANEAGAFEAEASEDETFATATDTEGMYRGTGSPQIGVEDDGFTVYSNKEEDLEQAQQGLSHYGIKYGEIRYKKTGHWHHYMRVYVPMDYKGNFLTLTEWLRKTNRKVEDVMRPDFVKRYNQRQGVIDNAEDTQLIQDIFNDYVAKKNSDYTLDTDSLLNQMFDEMEGLPFDRDSLEQKFRALVDTPSYYDIFDKYVEIKEADPTQSSEKLFKAMLKELKTYKIDFNKQEAYEEFIAEVE